MTIEDWRNATFAGAHDNLRRTQDAWDAVARDEFGQALAMLSDDVVVDNGPGAGPWRHIEGKEAFLDFVAAFVPFFQGTWHQQGHCIHADDRFSVTLVHETGTAPSGDRFDNHAVYVARYAPNGTIGRVWTTDLDHEDVEAFWQRNRPTNWPAQ
jgi:hypothetical protein